MSSWQEDVFRDDQAPCPQCGCPWLEEKTYGTKGEPKAWRDLQDGEWYCGPSEEWTMVRCLWASCDFFTLRHYRYGKVQNEVLGARALLMLRGQDGRGTEESAGETA